MNSTEYFTLDYIDTSPQLSADDFKVETIPEKIDTKVYYDNVQKHQL